MVGGATIFLNSDLYLPQSRAIHVTSNLIIDGNGAHDLIFPDGNMTFSIDAGVTLTLKDLHLRGVTGSNNFVGSGTLKLYNVDVSLDNNWTFSGSATTATKMDLEDYVNFYGRGKIFEYVSGGTLTMDPFTSLYFDVGTTFSWTSGRRLGMVMQSADLTIFLNNSTMFVGSRGSLRGLRLTKGSLICENKVTINNDGWSDSTRSFEWGDGASASNDLNVNVLSGACLDVNGFLYHHPST